MMNAKIKCVFCIVFCLFSVTSFSQSSITEDQSIALKTIRVAHDIPVAFHNELKGGVHQYAGNAWDSIPESRLIEGMMAYNSANNSYYRYVPTSLGSNLETDWLEMLVIDFYNASKNYVIDDVVIEGSKLYIATDATIGNSPVLDVSNNYWESFYSDDQIVDSFGIQATTDSLILSLENGNRVGVKLSDYHEKVGVYTNSNTTPNNTLVTSSGEIIILATSNYALPSAASLAGKTVTVKNNNSGATTTATQKVELTTTAIDGTVGYTLWHTYDYITIMSDGSAWYKIAEGGTKVAQGADIDDADDTDDAFYLGDPDVNNSWRMIFDVDLNVLKIQRREGDVWVNKTSVVP